MFLHESKYTSIAGKTVNPSIPYSHVPHLLNAERRQDVFQPHSWRLHHPLTSLQPHFTRDASRELSTLQRLPSFSTPCLNPNNHHQPSQCAQPATMVSDINPCIISNMAHFQIYPLSRFESGQTSIKRPKHFLRFSYDENRECHVGSDESLRYYYPPFFPAPGTDMHMPRINLSGGFESWIKSDQETPDHLDALLATIENHESSRLADGEKEIRVKADVVTWRGMMTKVS